MLMRIAWGVGVLLLLPAIVLALLSLLSRRPAALGVTQGRLKECPNTHACVSSQASDAARRVEAIAFDVSAEEALEGLRRAVAGLPNARIVTSGDDYLHAEFVSHVFRFVDDVEFLVDRKRRVIHCRSASRVGYYDFGANRRRVEQIRQRFTAAAR
jgi:uncharacterized protein (DUF1499 family)